MLDLVNRLADGFVAVPVIAALKNAGVFESLTGGRKSLAELSQTLRLHAGNLQVAIRFLEGLGWLDVQDAASVTLTERGLAGVSQIPADVDAMLASLPDVVAGRGEGLATWIRRCGLGWANGDGDVPRVLAPLLDGALLAPMLVELRQRGGAAALDEGQEPFGVESTALMLDLFAAWGWAEPDGRRLKLNGAGRYMVQSGGALGTVVSYWPMFRAVGAMLQGDATAVFARDADGHEGHLDRRLNIFGSTAQHGTFFREMEDAVVSYFETLPLAHQPSHIIDLGCGDGTLLKRLYGAIVTRTTRGARLSEHPLTLVAADYNEASLVAAREGLAGLPHMTVQADIGNPGAFMAELAARGVDPGGILHVRSFVDHDRPLLLPRDSAGVARRERVQDSGVHVDAAGGSVPTPVALQSLVEHLARWRDVSATHGLLVLEVHCVRPATTRRLNHHTEALHFDAYHAFARQHLVEAPTFLLAAAEAGLIPQTHAAQRFPRLGRYTRITLNRFIPKPYRIRLAEAADLPALLALEAATVDETLRSTASQIERRMASFPRGQLVAELDGAVVAAIYTQRIAGSDVLQTATADTIERLHRPDGPVAQLMWLLAHPDYRGRVNAEDLLDFTLDYLAAMDGVESVAGVTRCRDFARRADQSLSHNDYVFVRDSQGLPIDPVLLMHASHGARIERVLEGYRPRDTDNGGAGVLISYALEERHRRAPAAGGKDVAAPSPSTAPVGSARAAGPELAAVVRRAVERVLGTARHDAYQADRPLMSMGLESLDLLELRRDLGERLGVELESTFFFRHGTPEAIIRHLSGAAPRIAPEPGPRLEERDVAGIVRSAVERVLGAARHGAYQADRPLMAMGLESLDLLELRRDLGERLGVELDPTFFFRHGTPDAVIRHLVGPVSATGVPAAPETAPRAASGDGFAVVGLSCRLPGAADADAFWELLARGGDAVGPIDAARWSMLAEAGVPLEGLPREGALLSDIDQFDAGFFRISPREAALLDPKQRLLLEGVWRALEDAGIASQALAGSDTGVFLGFMGHDYESLILRAGVSEIDGHFATGNAASIAAGRLAHFFDWHGPAVTIDTACSSSLVAVHQACRALRAGDCGVAVAAGVNLTLSAHASLSYLRAGMLSPDGRCKTFDASADGYGRGEGVGVVVLKRLADAERDHDRILAVVRGSAVNQDGTGIGLTAPNQGAQTALIEAALADARLPASSVTYLECHGTGTVLGDPIEVGAAAGALGVGRGSDRPLLLGSVKASIGHLEAAAGIAGLIKVVLALRAGELPGQAHFRTPNPHIAWSSLPVAVVRERRDWPSGRRIAGVSSFGFSGTNAHVLLEGYAEPVAEPVAEAAAAGPGLAVLPVSAKTAGGVAALAERYGAWLAAHPAAELASVCFTAGAGRSHFAHRAAVVGTDRATLLAGLAALEAGAEHAAVRGAPGVRREGRPRVGVLFTGQGSQWAGMGQGLYASEPVFRAVVERCIAAVDGLGVLGQGLGSVLLAAPGTAAAGLLDDTAYTQPALYALQCGLWALWRHWGVEPVAVLGHSVGEFAAAQAAGVFGLEAGAALVARRGALMSALPAGGAMAVVFGSAEAVAAALADHPDLSLAAENGTHRVVSGPAGSVDAVVAGFAAAGVRGQRLVVSHAFHSALLDPMLDAFEAAAAGVAANEPGLTLVSNLTGSAFAPGTRPDAAYWRRHARAPVRYAEGVAALAAQGVDVLLELGPRPVLGPLALGSWPAGPGLPVVASALRPGVEDGSALGEAMAALYAAGVAIDFAARDAGRGLRRVALPGYPFARVRHWVDGPGVVAEAASGDGLLGVGQALASGEHSWTQGVSAGRPGWVADHAVFGTVVAPGALHACLAAAAGRALGGPGMVAVETGQIHAPLVLDAATTTLQLLVGAAEGDGAARPWRVFARGAEAADWRLQASGRLLCGAAMADAPDASAPDAAGLDEAGLAERDVAAFYAAVADLGIGYGPSFLGVERLWSGDGVARGVIAAPEGLQQDGGLHPAVLDACFQVAVAALPSVGRTGEPFVPLGWDAVALWGAVPGRLVCEVRLEGASSEAVAADLWLRDEAGAAFGRVRGLLLKRATRQTMLGSAAGVDELLYEVAWREVGVPAADAAFAPAPAGLVAAIAPRMAELAAAAGYEAARQAALEALLERMARAQACAALAALGWTPQAGARVEADALRAALGVVPAHGRLFGRLLGLAAAAGMLAPDGAAPDGAAPDGAAPEGGRTGVWRVADPGAGEPVAAIAAAAVAAGFAEAVAYVLLARCGAALAGVLRGTVAPLGLLFPEEGVGAPDLYRAVPGARLLNAMAAQALGAAVAALPAGRRLRVLEVGAGTGGTSGVLLAALPRGCADYVYTDVSAGFFAGAEARFAEHPFVSYQVLDIERDPVGQGFAAGGYDLVVASNVLHATRDVVAAASHCRRLLAPGGTLVLIEEMAQRGWADLTFGLLDGWWRFTDLALRPDHLLLDAAGWHGALAGAGFAEVAVLHPDAAAVQGLVMARVGLADARHAPDVPQAPGVWLLAADAGSQAEGLAAALALRGERVVVAAPGAALAEAGADRWRLRPDQASDWRALLAGLPGLRGVVYLPGLDAADAATAGTGDVAADAARILGGALALTQALIGQAPPEAGVWFVTAGAQVVLGEPGVGLAGAALWGMARSVAREHPELGLRRLDLAAGGAAADLVEEFLAPDGEDEVARRGGLRLAARLVRAGAAERLALPGAPGWRLAKGAARTLEGLHLEAVAVTPPEPGAVAVAVAAAGLNFRDVLDTLGLVPVDAGPLGGEFAGRVVAVGAGVVGLAPGDAVVGLGSGCFGDRVTTPATLVAACPAGLAPAAAAALPIVFVTAAIAFDLAALKAGDRVLIHAGAGGVGLAAIALAQAAGAEVYATASAGKQALLRGLGVRLVADSRSLGFADRVLAATGGRGVDVVLNSLTGEGFIAASLSVLAPGGRFIEIAKRDIWSVPAMAAARPDVGYHILGVDRMMAEEPARVGAVLRRVMGDVAAGRLRPLPYTAHPVAEARQAMRRMQAGAHVGKLVLTLPARPAGAPVRPGVTYLITGGLGGIGLAVAGWLADRGATHLALNGRRAPDAAAEAAVAALRARGVSVAVLLADVSEADAVDGLLAAIDAQLPPLAGVIHSVGLLRDGAVANQDWARFAAVLGPKVLGAWQLHRATLGRPLDLFVLFASTAGLLGNRGQANHAAANVFLDGLARHRQALGLPGLSLDWGAWAEIGEAAERRASLDAAMAAAGIGWMTPAQGLAALERALDGAAAQVAVVAADWPQVAAGGAWPLLGEVLATPKAQRTAAGAGAAPARPARAAAPVAQRLARLPASQRRGELTAWLAEAVQRVLRLPEAPDESAGFSALGLDSLMAVELRNRLNAELKLDPPLPATVLFDQPTLAALSRTIELQLGLAADPEPQAAPAPAASRQPKPPQPDSAVAIVGMACRFPGAPNLDTYWQLLQNGDDAVREIPDERRDIVPQTTPDGAPGAWVAGLLDGIEEFDPQHFRISPDEAPFIDPQQRLLLETAWHALEQAGLSAAELVGSSTGVFVGIGNADFATRHANDPDMLSVFSGAGSGGFAAANRISHAFGFTGPSMAVNTACASSLTALHLAIGSLRAGDCDLALVGGVNLMLHPSEYVSLLKAQVLSPSGRCRSFSTDADGYVRSEGCGVVVLRRQSDAQASGDRIAALVRGSAISHVGASNGLSAPNGPSQEAVMRAAAARGGIDPSDVDYLEAQGTGTNLGDAIELGAIRNVMVPGRDPARPLRIGAVKSNIGNVEEASGMAGLIKTVLAMRHGLIPPTLHFQGMNRNIKLDAQSIRVVAEAEPWAPQAGRRRIAAVSGFGYGGANAHVILEEAPTVPPAGPPARPPFVLAVRARTPANLERMAAIYADALAAEDAPEVGRFCHSANVGRSDVGYRLAVVGGDRDTLVRLLRTAAAGEDAGGIYRSGKPGQRRRRVGFVFNDRQPAVPLESLDVDYLAFRSSVERSAAMGDGRPGEVAGVALQAALAELWTGWGIAPDVIAGEGAGEIAAAIYAGVLSLENGIALARERARLLGRLADKAADETAALDAFEAFAGTLPHAAATRRLVIADGHAVQPATAGDWAVYWRNQVSRPAGQEDAQRRVEAAGTRTVLIMGHAPEMTQMPSAQARGVTVLASLRDAQRGVKAAIAETFAALFAAFHDLDFKALHGDDPPRVDVPLYAFERQRYWLDDRLSVREAAQ